jgi:hypothetical protein
MKTIGKRIGCGAGIALAVLAVSAAGAAASPGKLEQPAWQQGLKARSDALNRAYGLGIYTVKPARVIVPARKKGPLTRTYAFNGPCGLVLRTPLV